MSILYPAFASGDSILANTRVDSASGSAAHTFGAPNEETKVRVTSTSSWAQVDSVGVGLATSGHSALVRLS
eukprot:7299823-Prymnesium_polylepis.1